MTKFTDGPAAGVALHLRRSPLFLRVTADDDGFDALDQVADEADRDETIHVYIKESDDGACFVDGTDIQGRRRGWTELSATYKLHTEQPDDAVMRDRWKWQEWCQGQAKKMGIEVNQP